MANDNGTTNDKTIVKAVTSNHKPQPALSNLKPEIPLWSAQTHVFTKHGFIMGAVNNHHQSGFYSVQIQNTLKSFTMFTCPFHTLSIKYTFNTKTTVQCMKNGSLSLKPNVALTMLH